MEKIEATLIGDAPLITHNGLLADPRYEFTKALKPLTKKRDKSAEEMEEIRKIEWLGGLYRDSDGTIGLTADVLLACFYGGAKKSARGPKFLAGVIETQSFYPLVYDGPRDAMKLYKQNGFCDYRAVGINKKRVMRARPRFDKWSLPFSLLFNSSVIDGAVLVAAIESAGELVGLCERRPRFGRFSVEW
jgi:hypothetical protein